MSSERTGDLEDLWEQCCFLQQQGAVEQGIEVEVATWEEKDSDPRRKEREKEEVRAREVRLLQWRQGTWWEERGHLSRAERERPRMPWFKGRAALTGEERVPRLSVVELRRRKEEQEAPVAMERPRAEGVVQQENGGPT